MRGRFRRALCRAGCLVFTCLLILPSMAGCRKKHLKEKAFRFLLDSDPRQLDPQVSTDRSSVTMAAALFEGLARLDENGEAEPAAATWTVSEDRRTLHLHPCGNQLERPDVQKRRQSVEKSYPVTAGFRLRYAGPSCPRQVPLWHRSCMASSTPKRSTVGNAPSLIWV